MEGLVKDFYLSSYCQNNLKLMKHISYQIMTFQEWQLKTPESEKTEANSKKPDLFSMPKENTAYYSSKADKFYKEFLHLGPDENSVIRLNQDLDNISEKNNKFSWRMMCLTMTDIKAMVKFFSNHISAKNPAVRRTLEKVEFYDEEDKSFTEKPIDYAQS